MIRSFVQLNWSPAQIAASRTWVMWRLDRVRVQGDVGVNVSRETLRERRQRVIYHAMA
jgi:hypothetical protein